MMPSFARSATATAASIGLALAMTAGVAAAPALHARATLVDSAGNEVGWAGFVEDATGIVHVSAHARGMSPGRHGIHIHAVAACDPAAFTTAGGHHNPLGVAHGLASAGGGHGGDLPNLEVNAAGVGHLDATTDRATLSPGPTSVFDGNGSALIIHAGADDQITDPTGNSGTRIACGVIEWA